MNIHTCNATNPHACVHADTYTCIHARASMQNMCVCVCMLLVRRKLRYRCVHNCRRRPKTIDAAGCSRNKIVQQQAHPKARKNCISKRLTRPQARVINSGNCRHSRRRAKSSMCTSSMCVCQHMSKNRCACIRATVPLRAYE